MFERGKSSLLVHEKERLLFTVFVNFPRMPGQDMALIGTRSRSVKRATVLTLQTTQRKNRRASRDPYEGHILPRHALIYRQL